MSTDAPIVNVSADPSDDGSQQKTQRLLGLTEAGIETCHKAFQLTGNQTFLTASQLYARAASEALAGTLDAAAMTYVWAVDHQIRGLKAHQQGIAASIGASVDTQVFTD